MFDTTKTKKSAKTVRQQEQKRVTLLKQRDSIWSLPKLAKPFKPNNKIRWNPDDKIVYDM